MLDSRLRRIGPLASARAALPDTYLACFQRFKLGAQFRQTV